MTKIQRKKNIEDLYYEQTTKSIKDNPVFDKLKSDWDYIVDEELNVCKSILKKHGLEKVKEYIKTSPVKNIDWWILKKLKEIEDDK